MISYYLLFLQHVRKLISPRALTFSEDETGILSSYQLIIIRRTLAINAKNVSGAARVTTYYSNTICPLHLVRCHDYYLNYNKVAMRYAYCITESTIIFPFLFRLVKYLTRSFYSRSRSRHTSYVNQWRYTFLHDKGGFLYNIKNSFHDSRTLYIAETIYIINAFYRKERRSKKENQGKN